MREANERTAAAWRGARPGLNNLVVAQLLLLVVITFSSTMLASVSSSQIRIAFRCISAQASREDEVCATVLRTLIRSNR